MRGVRRGGVLVAREEDGVVGHLAQGVGERVVERRRVAAGQVGAAAAVEEEGVAGDEGAVEHEALAARRVARGVDQLDGDVADHHDVAAGVADEVAAGEAGGLLHELGLLGLHVDRHRGQLEQLADAHDVEAHHGAAHVVGVVVGGEGAGEVHAVGGEHVEDALGVVGGVDHDRLARLAVADQVDEVDHLAGHRVVGGDVAAGEQLAEVEA